MYNLEIAKTYNNIGALYLKTGEYIQAIDFFENSFNIYSE